MLYDNFHLHLKISKAKLNGFVQNELELFFKKKLDADGYTITLDTLSSQKVELGVKAKSIQAKIPIQFSFLKSAGLFSIEGEGIICIHLEINIGITENLSFSTQTLFIKHEWIKEPILRLGQLNIPIETLSNCIIKYLSEDVLDKFDTKISKEVNLNQIVSKIIKEFCTNYVINKKLSLLLNTKINQIQTDVLREDEQYVSMGLWLELKAKISDVPIFLHDETMPKFYWNNALEDKYSQKIDFELSYPWLAKIILPGIDGKEFGGKAFAVESIHIRNTNILEIKANFISPFKGIITITGIPYLDEENQKIYFKSLGVHVDASNIIYKITSSFIEKIINKKINDIFPLDILPILDSYVGKLSGIDFSNESVSVKSNVKRIKLDSLTFEDLKLQGGLLLNHADVAVTF